MTQLLPYPDITCMEAIEEKNWALLLKDMTSQQILDTPVCKLTLLRITAQIYCKLQNLLGPLLMSTKALSSRAWACELSNVNELEVDLKSKDPEFAASAQGYIVNLRKIDQILPFRRCWILVGYKLTGFVVSLDGGKLGFGTTIHSLGAKDGTELLRSLCLCKSRISKRNIVCYECLSGKLGTDGLYTLLQPLLYDFCHIIVSRISAQFPNANIMVGHVSGVENPADRMTKLFKDPFAIINSQLYREGPAKFGSLETLSEDLVATCTNGEFTFHGQPSKFLAEYSKSELMLAICVGKLFSFVA